MPVKKRVQTATNSTQKYLKLSEIHDDVVVLRNGELRVVLETSSINFDLKSPEEQQGVIAAYQQFLNSVNFPIQIIVRSRQLDINAYLQRMRVRADESDDQIMRSRTFDYIAYVEKLVEVADIMQKKFYVVIPFDPPNVQNKTFVDRFMEMINPADSVSAYKQRKKNFEKHKKLLMARVNDISSGLQSLGLEVRQLETKELIELFYNIYNPIVSMQERVEDVDSLNFIKA